MPCIVIAFMTLLALFCLISGGLGLLFPALNRLNYSADRMETMNNMRQIGLALHSYHDTADKKFPLICDHGRGSPTGFGVQSLHFSILPLIEEDKVHTMYRNDSPASYYSTPNGAGSMTIRIFLSPSEAGAAPSSPIEKVTVVAPAANAPFQTRFDGWYATTNFVANGMVFSLQPDGKPPSFATVVDGTANTIMLGERYRICKGANGEVPTLWGLGAYSASTASFALPLPEGGYPRTIEPQLVLQQTVPNRISVQQIKTTIGFQHQPKADTCDASIMQSLHPVGMVVCMFDSSVRLIRPDISPATFWAAVTPAGNDELGADW
jgi:Protein of unknown function (DUF1559)